MTARQRIEVRQAEIRARLGELADLDGEARTEEIETEQRGLLKELQGLQPRLAAVIASEDADAAATAEQRGADDGEGAELRELRGRVALSAYVGAALEGRAVEGAEREFNAALEIPAGRFPLELLAPAVEERATTDVDAGAIQGAWLDRLFADTAAMYLGVSFRSVAPGVAAYPVVTAGASAAQRGRADVTADAPWTVGVTDIKPTRNAVRAVFSETDAARLPGLEEALRRDLSMALTEGVDRAISSATPGPERTARTLPGCSAWPGSRNPPSRRPTRSRRTRPWRCSRT